MTKASRLLYWVILLIHTEVWSTDRTNRGLTYRHNNDDLNIEHIINLWNRSASDETSSPTDSISTTISLSTSTEKSPQNIKEKPAKPNSFIDRFNVCLKKHKFISKSYPDQAAIVRCLKTELVHKLNDLVRQPSATITLFNGYLEFHKLEKVENNETLKSESIPQVKKYSSRVSSKMPSNINEISEPFVPVTLKEPKASQSHASDYYESYQKMLKELVARKSGATRESRDGAVSRSTLEKSARFFETGRKLVTEISHNLENKEEDVETFTETILDPDLISSINDFTRSYSVRLNFYPGVAARMKRNQNSGVTFDLELDDLNEAEEPQRGDDGGRGGKKKNKKKISKKTLKKLFPYLLIPFMIQAALLPIVLKFLLFVAIKALIAGKLALILVAFNAIRNASLKTEEDEYIERMGYDHYGYSNGEEYGAWINSRSGDGGKDTRRRQDVEETVEPADAEYAEPFAAYRPDNEPRSGKS